MLKQVSVRKVYNISLKDLKELLGIPEGEKIDAVDISYFNAVISTSS
jgi:hypothetical protein